MLTSGWASSGYVKSIVTPSPRIDAVFSDNAFTLQSNAENKSSTVKKQDTFLARIGLLINNYSKSLFIVN
jgi:hypothetical protein